MALLQARTWIAAASSAVAAGLVSFATRHLGGAEAAALLYQLEALALGLAAPWVLARVVEDEEAGLEGRLAPRAAALVAGLVGAAAVALALALGRQAPGLGGALVAQVLVLCEGLALGSVTLGVGRARGSGAGLAAGLAAAAALLGAPYLLGDAIAALPRDLEALAVYWLVAVAPGLALAGTCAGTHPFHSAVLYERFRPVGEGHVGYEYASPLRATLVQGALAAAAVGLAVVARRFRRPSSALGRRAAAGAVLAFAFLLLGPSRADAQVMDNSSGTGGGSTAEGSFGIQIHLGYLYPFLTGDHKIQASSLAPGTRLDLQRDLHIEPRYILPTFEVQVGWSGIGRVWVDYFEMSYLGHFGGTYTTTFYRNVIIPEDEVGLETYTFRTVGLHGSISIPVLDFITLELIFTTRYVYFYSQVKAPAVLGLRDEATLNTIIPGLGPGFEFFILDKFYAYGDLAWIDFTVPQKRPLVHYREGHLGVRYEMFSNIHIGGEVVWLDVDIANYRINYHQDLIGPRFWIALAF